MNIKKIVGFLIICAIILTVGGYFLMKSPVKEQKLVIINVLDKDLYDDCHIKGSINVPFEKIEEYADKLDKSKHVVLYCSNYMCTASGSSAKMLKRMGFENVWAYEAGMADWYQAKLPVEGPCKEAYLNVKIEKPEHVDDNFPIITTNELSNKINLIN